MENITTAVQLTIVGMLGIFIALGIIYLATIGLQKYFTDTDRTENE